MKFLLISTFALFQISIFGQYEEKSLTKDISAIVFLDSFVVTATKKGFDVTDFIDIVQQDESFYRAFKNIRFRPHIEETSIKIFDKKHRVTASNNNRVQQFLEGNCRTMTFLSEDIQGKYFKNKKKRKHRYYTTRMQEKVFWYKGRLCGEDDNLNISSENLHGIQKHINELKRFIFLPGKEVNIPIIGGKTAIFTEDMLKYYNFSITSKKYKDQQDCYVFRAIANPTYRSGKTIIKYLETYFDKNNFQVLVRNYHLKYDGLVDFDVKMKVELTKIAEKYFPVLVEYDGNWKIPTQKREIVDFRIDFVY